MNTTKINKVDGEYRVRLFVDGVYQVGADYFTDDREDAHATAKHMQQHGGISDKTTKYMLTVTYNDAGMVEKAVWEVANKLNLTIES